MQAAIRGAVLISTQTGSLHRREGEPAGGERRASWGAKTLQAWLLMARATAWRTAEAHAVREEDCFELVARGSQYCRRCLQ